MMQKDISEIKDKVDDLANKSSDADVRFAQLEIRVDYVAEGVDDLKDEVKKLTDKPDLIIPTILPWHKEFKNIMILVGIVAFLIQSLATTNPDVAETFIRGMAGVFGADSVRETVDEVP